MARVKLTEYRTKKIFLKDHYSGISIGPGITLLPRKGRFVLKVDEGIKKRLKQGLVALDVTPAQISRALKIWKKKGYSRFLLEQYFPHKTEEEQYLSLERVRGGIRWIYARAGGVDVEAGTKTIQGIFSTPDHISEFAKATKLPTVFITNTIQSFETNYLSFVEFNPLVVRGGVVHMLDAAAEADSAGSFFVSTWGPDDMPQAAKHSAEKNVEALAQTTPASLKLKVLNQNGSLFFLLSGGGGSLVIADEAAALGAHKHIGNYGEYSGGPSTAETYLYAKEVITLLLHSKAKKKALVIAGGVANFTDIKQTFDGIIAALLEVAPQLRARCVRVFVRRGGPNELEGLTAMKEFLTKEKLLGSVHGSEAILTQAVTDALTYLNL